MNNLIFILLLLFFILTTSFFIKLSIPKLIFRLKFFLIITFLLYVFKSFKHHKGGEGGKLFNRLVQVQIQHF